MLRPWPLRLLLAGPGLALGTWLVLGAAFAPFGNPLHVPKHADAALLTFLLAIGSLAVTAAWVGLPLRLAERLTHGLMGLAASLTPDPGRTWWFFAQRAATPMRLRWCLHRGAAWGHPESRLEEALSYLDGGWGEGGAQVGVRLLSIQAQEGSAEAAFYLAEALRWGRGQPKDLAAAWRWYRRSGEAGFGPSAAWMAKAYQQGEGIDVDLPQSQQWSRRATQAPPAPPRGMLRQMRGEQTSRWGEVVQLGTQMSEALGDAVIQTAAGRALVLGVAATALVLSLLIFFSLVTGITLMVFFPPFVMLGVLALKLRRSNRWTKASRDLQSRAEQGDPDACYQQGLGFEQGSAHHPRDASEARLWYQRAADAGHVEAAYRLGVLLAWGIGGMKDRDKAKAWLDFAARHHHEKAAAQWQDLERSAADADR